MIDSTIISAEAGWAVLTPCRSETGEVTACSKTAIIAWCVSGTSEMATKRPVIPLTPGGCEGAVQINAVTQGPNKEVYAKNGLLLEGVKTDSQIVAYFIEQEELG